MLTEEVEYNLKKKNKKTPTFFIRQRKLFFKKNVDRRHISSETSAKMSKLPKCLFQFFSAAPPQLGGSMPSLSIRRFLFLLPHWAVVFRLQRPLPPQKCLNEGRRKVVAHFILI